MNTIKIDCTLIEKARLFPGKKPNKAGKMPQYLDLILIENKNGKDDYGNTHFVAQSVSKEEREKGIRGPILGNARIEVGDSKPAPRAAAPKTEAKPADDDQCPF